MVVELRLKTFSIDKSLSYPPIHLFCIVVVLVAIHTMWAVKLDASTNSLPSSTQFFAFFLTPRRISPLLVKVSGTPEPHQTKRVKR